MGLNGNDCKHLLEIVDIIYGSSCRDVLLSHLFEKLEKTIGISSAVFLRREEGSMCFKVRSGVLLNCRTAEAEAFASYYAPLDPFLACGWFANHPNRACRNTDLVPKTRLANSEFAVDFLSTVPCFWIIGVSLGTVNHPIGMIGLHRLRHERDFSDRDIEFVNAFAPHVSRALILFEHSARQQQTTGIVILDTDGTPIYVSDDAARILGRQPIAAIALPIVKPHTFEGSDGTYNVHVAISACKHRVITLQPAAHGEIDSHLALLGLSLRQQEITRRVIEGLSNIEIANELHIAEQTVKDHLHDIFRKVGVRRRSELATRVLRLNRK